MHVNALFSCLSLTLIVYRVCGAYVRCIVVTQSSYFVTCAVGYCLSAYWVPLEGGATEGLDGLCGGGASLSRIIATRHLLMAYQFIALTVKISGHKLWHLVYYTRRGYRSIANLYIVLPILHLEKTSHARSSCYIKLFAPDILFKHLVMIHCQLSFINVTNCHNTCDNLFTWLYIRRF